MIEDLDEDVGLIERVLKEEEMSFISERVDTKDEYTEALKTFNPDVILSDHSLPQFNSIEALSILQQQGIRIPFILVTGTVSEEFAVHCLKLGANDYVLKSNLSRLPAALKNALQQHTSELKKKRAELNLLRHNKKLQKINNELDNFVYSVSHNLRGPLLSVLGLVQLAQREDIEGKFAIYFGRMTKSIGQLQYTLKEILDYSKNSRSGLIRERIDMGSLLAGVLENLEYMDGFKKVSIHYKVDQQIDFRSDPLRIKILLNNLICNSIQYRNEKVASFIDIKVVIASKMAHLRIHDNGIGIEKDILPRVYDMFFRGHKQSEGAGLGLYIAREAVMKLKGKINALSESGQYTTFDIMLPNLRKDKK